MLGYQSKSHNDSTKSSSKQGSKTISSSNEKSKIIENYQLMADNSESTSKLISDSNKIVQKNDTGLPDNLKHGVESLSGHSMNDVKVHYNSDQPAQLNAHAFAKGTDIHIAPGQEKHLPHEAWHVAQQKQGRVKATTQLKEKVNINDDAKLEQEADVMGVKAMNFSTDTISETFQLKSLNDGVIQREVDTSSSPSLQDTADIDAIDAKTNEKQMAVTNAEYLKEQEGKNEEEDYEGRDAIIESDLTEEERLELGMDGIDVSTSDEEVLNEEKRTSMFSGLTTVLKGASDNLSRAFNTIKSGSIDAFSSAKSTMKSGMSNMAKAAKLANSVMLPVTKRLNKLKEKIEKSAGGAGKLIMFGIKQIPVIGSIISFIFKASKSSVRFGDYSNFSDSIGKIKEPTSDLFEALKFSAGKAWRGFLKAVTATISSALGIIDDVISISTAGLGGALKIFKGLLALIPTLYQYWRGFKKKFITKNLHQDRIQYTKMILAKALNGSGEEKTISLSILRNIDPKLTEEETILNILSPGTKKKGYFFNALNEKWGKTDDDEHIKKSALYKAMDSKEGGNLDGIGAGYDITEGVLTAESGDPDYTIVDQIVENLPDDQQEFITDVQDVSKDLPESIVDHMDPS